MRVDVEGTVDAPPERVWDLLVDVTRIAAWSPECVHTDWLGENRTPRAGARFTALNRRQGDEWRVTCVVVECERPHSFGWVVLDDDERASSTWRFELEPLDGDRTAVRESFEHGPGDSRLRLVIRSHPELDPAAIVEFRREELRRNMTQTMAGMARVAEAGRVRIASGHGSALDPHLHPDR